MDGIYIFLILFGVFGGVIVLIFSVCQANEKHNKALFHNEFKERKKIKLPFTSSQYFFNTRSQKKLNEYTFNLLKSKCITVPKKQDKHLQEISKLFLTRDQKTEHHLTIAFNSQNEMVDYYWETNDKTDKVKIDAYRFYNFYKLFTNKEVIYNVHNHPGLIIIPSYTDLTNFYRDLDWYLNLKTLIINENGEILDVKKMFDNGLCYDPAKTKKKPIIIWPTQIGT